MEAQPGRVCVLAGVSGALCTPLAAAPLPNESRGWCYQHGPGRWLTAGPALPWPQPWPGPDSAVSSQPLMSLNNSVTTQFADPGDVRVTVQAACGTSVLQDSRVIRVLGESLPEGQRALCGSAGLGAGVAPQGADCRDACSAAVSCPSVLSGALGPHSRCDNRK